MTEYTVHATSWSSPNVVELLLPARDLSFSLPLSDHGECSFSATVEPGRSSWRAAITPGLSGIIVCRDEVPVWSGWVTGERESGGRSFQFSCKEWGSIFARFPAPTGTWTNWNDHDLFRLMVTSPQAASSRNPQVVTTASQGAARSDLTIAASDNRNAEEAFRSIADAEGGPEWAFVAAGTVANPKRVLLLADRLGTPYVADGAVLQYVEDTPEPKSASGSAPRVALLGDLFPVGSTASGAVGRRGGNVLEKARTRDTARSTMRAIAIGDGVDAAQLRREARANRLIDTVGWPELTTWTQHSSVVLPETLQRHANADLEAASGIATGWALATLDGDPDWTQIPRGSMVRVSLDTDVYAGPRPLVFETRLLNTKVDVPNEGRAQITYEVADVLDPS